MLLAMDAFHVLFETVHGSRAYGLAREGSDTDHKGVIVGPPAWYFGFRPSPEQVETGKDRVLFELRKFVRLAAAGNPTLLEVLFTDPADHVVVAPGGARLLAAREGFLSRRVAESFGGYALAQLKRIRTHRRWLLTPPERPPARAEFGLPEQSTVSRHQLGAAEALAEHGEVDLPPNFLDLLERERRYRGARKVWTQYQEWLRGRNPDRAALEARFG
jgi:predicted nucleotidyltransferase